MRTVSAQTDSKIPTTYIDVIYLTNKPDVPGEIRRLFRQKQLSYFRVSISQCSLVRERADLVGTVVIDASEAEIADDRDLGGVIESLEMQNVGVILLTDTVQLPVRSFSLAPVESSFSMARKVESMAVDDLWVRVSLNLSQRQLRSKSTVKTTAGRNGHGAVFGNRLTRQLEVTGALVDNLTEQLRMAGLVQRDFLPSQLPNTDEVRWACAFLPAEWVSGDMYDIARVDEEHIGFYVADAVGHAMPAALLTIFVKQALVMRETVGNNYRVFSPVEVMTNLNAKMTSQRLSGYQFATCCYCLLNTETLRLSFARAGHPYPILLRPGDPPEQLQVRGSLLGVFENAEYVQQNVQLEPGDKLLLYSDGAESFIGGFDDQRGFCFTDEFRELAELSVPEMVDRLTQLGKSKAIDPAEIDDITIVGLELL